MGLTTSFPNQEAQLGRRMEFHSLSVLSCPSGEKWGHPAGHSLVITASTSALMSLPGLPALYKLTSVDLNPRVCGVSAGPSYWKGQGFGARETRAQILPCLYLPV